MTMLSHTYFGELNLGDDVIYEKEIYLANNDKPTDIWLWLYSDNREKLLTIENLDKCAKICQNINELHQKSQPYLIDYLSKDPDFIAHYKENIDDLDLPKLQDLIDNNTLTPQNFVELLHLYKVGIWLTDDFRIVADDKYHQIVLDYMIDSE